VATALEIVRVSYGSILHFSNERFAMPARKKGAAKNAPARSKASKSQAAAKLPSRKTADKSKAPKTRTAEPSKKRVDFKIHAGARQVSVAGSFNERDPSADTKQPNAFGSYNSVVSV